MFLMGYFLIAVGKSYKNSMQLAYERIRLKPFALLCNISQMFSY